MIENIPLGKDVIKRIEPLRAAVKTAASACANGGKEGKTPACTLSK